MVAQRDHVRARLEQFVRQRPRDAVPGRRIFGIDDHGVHRAFTAQPSDHVAKDAAPRPADKITHQENFHIKSVFARTRP
jgi:hypothetical protein